MKYSPLVSSSDILIIDVENDSGNNAINLAKLAL